MRDLRLDEIQAVSGAGLIGKIVTGILVKKAINAALKQGHNPPHQPPRPIVKFPKFR